MREGPKANAVFFALGDLAYNLAVAARRLTLDRKSRSMRQWRLRRDVIDLAAAVARHARGAVVRCSTRERRPARPRLVRKRQRSPARCLGRPRFGWLTD